MTRNRDAGPELVDAVTTGRIQLGGGRTRTISTGWPTHRARDRSRKRHQASLRRRRRHVRRWIKRNKAKRQTSLT